MSRRGRWAKSESAECGGPNGDILYPSVCYHYNNYDIIYNWILFEPTLHGSSPAFDRR